MPGKKTRSDQKPSSSGDKQPETIIWGSSAEKDDFIKVPRAVLMLGRYDPDLMKKMQPRHLILLLLLAARKYQEKEIRAHWARLAEDMGVKVDTVRKWGYELKEKHLLKINPHRRRDPALRHRYGLRNDSNGFDISPFVQSLKDAFSARSKDRKKKRRENMDSEAD